MNCALASDGKCSGPIQLHHCVEQRWIKDRFRYGAVRSFDGERLVPLSRVHVVPVDALTTCGRLLDDERNLVLLCTFHHELVTNRRRYVKWPASVWEFAAETGLTSKLEKQKERVA